MSTFSELASGLGKPVADLVKNIGGIIDNVSTTDEERLKASNAAQEAIMKYHTEIAGVMVSEASTRADVVKAEVNSQSALTRNWRPIAALSYTFTVVYTYFIGPLFSLKTVELPDKFWVISTMMVGGYTFARSADKILPKLKRG